MSLLADGREKSGQGGQGEQIDRQGIRRLRNQEFRRHQDVAVAPSGDPCGGRGGGAGGGNSKI